MKILNVCPWILLMLCCATARTAEVSIADDGMLIVNGDRTFVLGLYENPGDDAELARMAGAGFNLVYARGTAAELDRLQSHGVFGWVNTGANLDLSEDGDNRRTALAKMAEELHGHPALLVWEVPDEALWNCWYGAMQWRWSTEPAELRAKIGAVQDNSLREECLAAVENAMRLRDESRYLESESLMDDVWKRIGLESPHPSYGLSNAQERSDKMRLGMLEGYHLLKELAPGRPIWMNHAPRNQIEQLAAFNEAADMVGCDIYPVPFHPAVGHSDLENRALSCVGDYTVRMQAAAPGKPVWMVLQGFGWGDIQPDQPEEKRKELRRPTLAETRFMAYDSIVRGARGLLYWGTQSVEKDAPFITDLLAVISELHGLRDVLAAPDADLGITVDFQPTFGSVDRSVIVLAKSHGDLPWLITVNEWTGALDCTLHGLDNFNGTVYRDRLSGVEASVQNGALSLVFGQQSVRVLEPVKK